MCWRALRNWYFLPRSLYPQVESKEERANENERASIFTAAFGCGVDSEQGGRIGSPLAIKRSIPGLTQDARYVPQKPGRDALRALLFNQPRGAGY